MSDEYILNLVVDSLGVTAVVAGIGWVGQKVTGESFSPNPSKSWANYFKMSVAIAGGLYVRTRAHRAQRQRAQGAKPSSL